MTKILSCIFSIFVLASCSIEMNMLVHSDYTGKMEIKIDISEMMGFIGLDSLSQEAKDSVFNEMNPGNEVTDEEKVILAESGLSDLRFDVNEEFITMSYDFDDINNAFDLFFVMDSSITEEQLLELQEKEYFVKEEGKFTIQFSDDGLSEMLNEGLESEGSEDDMDMSFMLNLFTMKQSYTFEREVFDVVDNDLPIRIKGNRVYFTTNMTEYLDEFVGKEIIVLFEKGKKKRK